MILDWSYNYHANNMYQQVSPIELYVKKQNNSNIIENNNIIIYNGYTYHYYVQPL